VRLAAEGLEAELCKALEYLPKDNRLLMRAGVGRDPGLIDIASVGADLESPSGFAPRTGGPVISNHLEHEQRFETPELLKVLWRTPRHQRHPAGRRRTVWCVGGR
jgi:hypothetical protein